MQDGKPAHLRFDQWRKAVKLVEITGLERVLVKLFILIHKMKFYKLTTNTIHIIINVHSRSVFNLIMPSTG